MKIAPLFNTQDIANYFVVKFLAVSMKSPLGIFYYSNLIAKNLMNKQTIVSLVVILIGVTALVWWSKSVDSKKLGAEGEGLYHLAKTGNNLEANSINFLVASETFYDFGTISMKNGKVSKIFKITNPTSQDIKIPSLVTSCMCTTAYILGEDGTRSRPYGMPGHGGAVPKANSIVRASGSLNIEAVYDPNAHGPAGVGLIERSVLLEDENNNVIEFKFRVNVTP